MVLLAKWLLEHDPEARILVVTDRDELDKQIEGVMKNAGVIGENSPSPRITSRRSLSPNSVPPHPGFCAHSSTSSTPLTSRARRRMFMAASTSSLMNVTAPRAAT